MTRRKSSYYLFFVIFMGVLFFPYRCIYAADVMKITIVPSFFDVNLNPGETWKSFVRVVNPNQFNVSASVSVVGMDPGKEGADIFTPIDKKNTELLSSTLSEWVDVVEVASPILRGRSTDIPFSIKVPQDAPPGGHYAALLISVVPSENISSGQIAVRNSITSLMFVRVAGHVYEEAVVSEFSSSKKMYTNTDVEFALSLRNTGNVHIAPKGFIAIYDILGREKKTIPVVEGNDTDTYIFPRTDKRFVKTWNWREGIHVGLYRAVAYVSLGGVEKKTITKSIYIWVIPVKEALGILFIMIFGIFCMAIMARWYVQRLLSREAALFGGAKGDRGNIKDQNALDLREHS